MNISMLTKIIVIAIVGYIAIDTLFYMQQPDVVGCFYSNIISGGLIEPIEMSKQWYMYPVYCITNHIVLLTIVLAILFLDFVINNIWWRQA